MPRFPPLLLLLASLLAAPAAAGSETLGVPALFSDHMVLQRGIETPLWGRAPARSTVRVTRDGDSLATVADADGRWRVELPAREAGGPFEIRIEVEGEAPIRIEDVLVGEVWLCAGQSNMGLTRGAGAAAADPAPDPLLRHFWMRPDEDAPWQTPATETGGRWQPANRANVAGWSEVAHDFGRRLRRELGVPVGLLTAAMGFSIVESWISAPAFDASERLRRIRDERLQRVAERSAAHERGLDPSDDRPFRQWIRSTAPAANFNLRVHPAAGYGIRGVLWWHGESNANRPGSYAHLLAALVADWRARWGLPDLPFLYLQLQGDPNLLDGPASAVLAAGRGVQLHLRQNGLREAQRRALLGMDGAGMVATHDLEHGLHPEHRGEFAERLAGLALTQVYGRAGDGAGPVLEDARAENGALRLRFRYASSGLTAAHLRSVGGQAASALRPGVDRVLAVRRRDGGEVMALEATPDEPLAGFAVAGDDGFFFPARARIEGDTIVVENPERVAHPTRAAYPLGPGFNLYNGEGLPASPFFWGPWPDAGGAFR